MSIKKTEYSIKNISLLLDNEDEMLLYGQFLDCFFAASDKAQKCTLINEEPEYSENHIVFMSMVW